LSERYVAIFTNWSCWCLALKKYCKMPPTRPSWSVNPRSGTRVRQSTFLVLKGPYYLRPRKQRFDLLTAAMSLAAAGRAQHTPLW